MNRRRFLMTASATLTATPALAGPPSYAVRLIGGVPDGDGYLAAIEISLEPGWKTYWRVPGEAGIPPEFNWQHSQNLAEADVLFPVPHRFEDAGGEGIGYKDRVVMPIQIRPGDPQAPVALALELFFAVCKDVCIPATARAHLQLGLTSPSPGDSAAVEQALADVPRRNVPLPFSAATLSDRQGQTALILSPAGGAATHIDDVFVESSSGAYFREPRAAEDGALYLLVDGVKGPGELRGQVLRLTVTGPGGALEGEITAN